MAVALTATTLVLGIGVAITLLQSRGQSAAALAMGRDMDMRDLSRYWAFPWLQATGLVGLLGLFVATPLGLWTALRRAQGKGDLANLVLVHRRISVAVLLLVLLHVVLTTLDNMGDTLRTVLVPGAWADQGWPEAVTGYNTGIFALYAFLLLAASYYLGGLRMGYSRWRWLHRAMWVAYGASVWHALILGLDVDYYAGVRPVIWAWQLPCAVLLLARALVAAKAARAARQRAGFLAWIAISGASAIGALAVLVLVASGNFDIVRTV